RRPPERPTGGTRSRPCGRSAGRTRPRPPGRPARRAAGPAATGWSANRPGRPWPPPSDDPLIIGPSRAPCNGNHEERKNRPKAEEKRAIPSQVRAARPEYWSDPVVEVLVAGTSAVGEQRARRPISPARRSTHAEISDRLCVVSARQKRRPH